MPKPEEILERNRQRSEQRAQQRAQRQAKPENATDFLERLMMGGVYLFLWIGAIILAVMLFAFSSFAGAVIFGSWINGVILGGVVTFGVGYVFYKVGSHLF